MLLLSELNRGLNILELVTLHLKIGTLRKTYASANVFKSAVRDLIATHNWFQCT